MGLSDTPGAEAAAMADDPTPDQGVFETYEPQLYEGYRQPPESGLIRPEPSNAELRAADPTRIYWPALIKLLAVLVIIVVITLVMFPPDTWTFA